MSAGRSSSSTTMTRGGLVSVSYTAMRGAPGPVGTSAATRAEVARRPVAGAWPARASDGAPSASASSGRRDAPAAAGRLREQPVEEGLHGGAEYSTATAPLKRRSSEPDRAADEAETAGSYPQGVQELWKAP